mgnify:CR=1 FL=1
MIPVYHKREKDRDVFRIGEFGDAFSITDEFKKQEGFGKILQIRLYDIINHNYTCKWNGKIPKEETIEERIIFNKEMFKEIKDE